MQRKTSKYELFLRVCFGNLWIVHREIWYPVPAIFHKVLKDGADIMETFDLPVGFHSEEPLECYNKMFREELNFLCTSQKNSKMNLNSILLIIFWGFFIREAFKIRQFTEGCSSFKFQKFFVFDCVWCSSLIAPSENSEEINFLQ